MASMQDGGQGLRRGVAGAVGLAWLLGASAGAAGTATPSPPLPRPPSALEERLHARAVALFRQGRFAEAYGRFHDLANTGHPASARYALWMCDNGTALFGSAWDCAPHEVEDWVRSATVAAPPARRADTAPSAVPVRLAPRR